MPDAPVVLHFPQQVMDLASRPAERDSGDDETKDFSDETEKEFPPGSARSNDLNRPQRRQIRIHRVGHGKTKRSGERKTTLYSANMGLKRNVRQGQNQIQRVQKSRVDPNLGGTDPFGAFELPQDSTTDLALHHWANVFQNTRMPITPRKAWMKINLSDKTLLSVTTYCSTYHFYFIRAMRPPPSSISQKLNAIQNINKTLQKPGSIPNDYTMVAVAVMTLLECLAGDLTACVIHRKGLQLMVHIRGGLQNLGFDGAAQRTVSWADTCCAILLREKPSLNPILISDAGESPIPGFTIGNLKERLLRETTSPDLCQKVIYVWLRLRYLTEFVTNIPDKNTLTIDDYFFSDKIDVIERYILSLLHSDSLAHSGAVGFLTAFLNASLIYIYEELRECPKWTNVCVCLSQRIHSGLQMVDLSSVVKNCPDMLLWIVLLGRSGTSPLGGPGKLWFLEAISDMEDQFNLEVPTTVAGLKYFKLAEEARSNGSESGTQIKDDEIVGGGTT